MTFLEFQKYLVTDHILNEYIKKNVNFEKINVKKKGKYDFAYGKMALIESGTLFQTTAEKKVFFVRSFAANEFMCLDQATPTTSPLIFEAVEESVLAEFNVDELIAFLDNEGVLSNFLFQIWTKSVEDLSQLSILSALPAQERVIFSLSKIAEKYNIKKNNNTHILPPWLNINILARASNCSRVNASRCVNQLIDEGKLFIYGKEWIITKTDLEWQQKKHVSN